MKYRQWKKNYKKLHGVNPPLELDKRKQRRLAKKAVKTISRMDLAAQEQQRLLQMRQQLLCGDWVGLLIRQGRYAGMLQTTCK